MKMRQLDLLLRKALMVLQGVSVEIQVFVVLTQKHLLKPYQNVLWIVQVLKK
jgi:hypothetical protein